MNISVMYKIYHRSCDFSTRSAWVCSNRWMDCGGRSGFATPARRVAEKLAPSLRWAQGKTAMRPCRLDLATVRQGSIATGGWIAEEGRVLRRVRNRSVLCTRLLRRRSKARDYPQAATAGYIFHKNQNNNRVGGCSLFEQPSSHTTVRAVRHTAVQ